MDVITFPVNLLTTSGLSILLHGVISLPDATSYDNVCYWSVQYSIISLNGYTCVVQDLFFSEDQTTLTLLVRGENQNTT